MTIKTTGAGKRVVETLRKIGSPDDDDTFCLFKSVKLDQKLIQSLFHIVLEASINIVEYWHMTTHCIP
jgi:hypothetical protein